MKWKIFLLLFTNIFITCKINNLGAMSQVDYLNTNNNVNLKRQVHVNREIALNFSGPAVATTLIDYYHNIKVSQYQVADKMKTNIGHSGTEPFDFQFFLINHVATQYNSKELFQNFGTDLLSIKMFIMQIISDLEHLVIPVILVNGYLPNHGSVVNNYVIINGIYGDLDDSLNIIFDYVDTYPGTPSGNSFTGHQLNLLWKYGSGYYFGI